MSEKLLSALKPLGDFISKVGLPVFIIVFSMFFFLPIIKDVSKGHVDYLEKTAASAKATAENVEKLVQITKTGNDERAAQSDELIDSVHESKAEHHSILEALLELNKKVKEGT